MVLVLGGGCATDNAALVSAPDHLALGAYRLITLGDACGYNPRLGACNTESLKELLEVRVDDPRVLRIVAQDEAPERVGREHGAAVVEGASEGKTRIHMRGLFSDGSERQADHLVEVIATDAIQLMPTGCSSESTGPTVPRGTELSFQVELHGRGKLLDGYLSEPVRGEGISCEEDCVWRSDPLTGSHVEVTSRLTPTFLERLSSYVPDDVTEIRLGSPAAALTQGTTNTLSYTLTVRDDIPCQAIPIAIESVTPNVCVGPEGAPRWHSVDNHAFSLQSLRPGSCKIALTAQGAARSVSRVTLQVH